MKKFNVTILLLAVVLIVGGISLFMLSKIENQTVKKDQVYVVIKTVSENIDFWGNVTKGAEVAATELGVDVYVVGPEREIYIEDQIAILESLIDKRPEAIAVAASDYEALGKICDKIIDEGITLVTFDSDANMVNDHSFVATNSYSAAQRIGHELATLLDGVGVVSIISHVEGASTAFERVEGFKQGIKPFDDIKITGDIIYTDNSQEIAYESTLAIVENTPSLTAIYATNEVTLLGSGQAIRDLGLQDEITVVGFDMTQEIALLIEQGVIDGTIVQKPFNMGYISIKEALEVMNGKKPEVVDTGAVLINKENMFLAENQKLIVPNVK